MGSWNKNNDLWIKESNNLNELEFKLYCGIPKNGITLEMVMDYYSDFLHDGDYEKYNPNINLVPGSREYLVQALFTAREMTRAIWLMNRLTKFGDVHWSLLNKEFQVHYGMILYWENQIKAYDDYSRSESERRTSGTKIGPIGAIIEAN